MTTAPAPVAENSAVPGRAALTIEASDFFGAAAAVLVALPSAIAYGVVVFSAMGPAFTAAGAMAGIVGTIVLGLIAPVFGGTLRLVTAPCAPAAAVLAALAAELSAQRLSGVPVAAIPLAIALVALLAGILQLAFGAIGGGRLIKYIPYPVVAGFMSGVGLLIFLGQFPKLLGVSGGGLSLLDVSRWNFRALAIGVVAGTTMLLAPRVFKRVPAAILALAAGVLAYFAMSLFDPALLTLDGNRLVIGPIGGASGGWFAGLERWKLFGALDPAAAIHILVPAVTLAILLSIDTLKTCVIADAITRSRHDSNRELRGQGLANLFSAALGGMPGAGTMGPTMVNISSGARTRASGVLVGVFALVIFVALGDFVAWVPLPALAGILIVIAFRMVDWNSLKLVRQRATILDFLVVGAVIVTAVYLNLIAAAGVGFGLAVLLFLREQVRGSVVRRKFLGNEMFSKKRRIKAEMAALDQAGPRTVVFELQGPLFFGTTDQLFSELEPQLARHRYFILDMKRVKSFDFTAARLLGQIQDQITERGGWLLLSDLPRTLPTGQDLKSYLWQSGLIKPSGNVKFFGELDDALEWVEDRILEQALPESPGGAKHTPLALAQIDVLSGLPSEALSALAPLARERSYSPGQHIFRQGDAGDELFLIRRGTVRIVLPIGASRAHHLVSFKRGDFFGDMSFLDHGTRSADAVASTDVELYCISRKSLDEAVARYPKLGELVFSRIAHVLALRLRQTDRELRALEEA